MKTIGGFLCARNLISLDYCWREAIQSMLPICDQISVSDCESTDGTLEALREWSKAEPKITICHFPWTDPKGDPSWYPGWLSHARENLKTDYAIYLDADEIFEPAHLQRIRDGAERGEVLQCYRWNFWRDPKHLIPKGVCLGTDVIRAAPQRMFLPSDYPDPRATEAMSLAKPAEVWIYHYGFLRERGAFFRKARTVQRIWANDYDPRLEKAETFDGQWATMPGVTGWEDKLANFDFPHPEIIKPWLRERGMEV